MVFSTFQFLVTTSLAVICAGAIGFSEGDISVLALLIPALWMLPQGGAVSLILLAAMTTYGLTLSHQPITISISVWMLFPLLMVVFSKRSSIGVLVTTTLIVVTLQVGIMVTQSAGKLEGTASVTMIQTFSIVVMWWAASNWRSSNKHSWWALILILPLLLADMFYTALIALSVTAIIASIESLSRVRTFNWGKLLCWTLPTVGFATLIVTPNIDVPNPVFVVWLCLLCTAWMTDYILRSLEEESDL